MTAKITDKSVEGIGFAISADFSIGILSDADRG